MTWILQIPRPSDGRFQWRARQDGALEVLSAPRAWQAYALAGPDANTKRTSQWTHLAAEASAETGVPLHWLLGFIYSESGGDPNAHAAGSPCHGLMQIMGSVAKAYGVQNVPGDLYDPRTNIFTGARILADHRKKTMELPLVASMYNAGPSPQTGLAKLSTKNPWGLVQDVDYIDHVVMSSNWFLAGSSSSSSSTPPTNSGAGLLVGIGLLWALSRAK